MSAVHGSNTDVVGNGYILSQFLNSASFSGSRDAAETTTFKKKSKTYIPGLRDDTMSVGGVWSGDLDEADQILWAALGAGNGVFSYIPQGYEVFGRLGYSFVAIDTSYEITTDVGDVAQISAELAAGDNGVGFERGFVTHPMAQENASGNGPTLDGTTNGFATPTANGVSLAVHVLNAVNLNVFLQDSADNSTFADLPGSIVVGNGRSSQRLWVPGTVRRYVRVRWTGTGQFLTLTNRK